LNDQLDSSKQEVVEYVKKLEDSLNTIHKLEQKEMAKIFNEVMICPIFITPF